MLVVYGGQESFTYIFKLLQEILKVPIKASPINVIYRVRSTESPTEHAEMIISFILYDAVMYFS